MMSSEPPQHFLPGIGVRSGGRDWSTITSSRTKIRMYAGW